MRGVSRIRKKSTNPNKVVEWNLNAKKEENTSTANFDRTHSHFCESGTNVHKVVHFRDIYNRHNFVRKYATIRSY